MPILPVSRRWRMRRPAGRQRGCRAMALLLLGLPATSAAQRVADEAQLYVGVALLHASGGGTLWQVPGQPFLVSGGSDTLALGRQLNSGFGVAFSGTYFPERHIGIAGEFQLTRLGSGDTCRIIRTGGSSFTQDLCGSLNNTEYTTPTAAFALGLVLRPGFRGAIQPYGRLMGGFAVLQKSFVRTSGFARTGGGLADVAVYLDEDGTATTPYLAVAAGFAAPLGPGWQLRWELRDNYVRIPAISAATIRQGLKPSTHLRGHHYFSFSLGFDIVLERKRGRRY